MDGYKDKWVNLPMEKSGPYGIVLGADGAMWFTEITGNKIGRIATSGEIIEYQIPTPESEPHGLVPGSDGGIWFAEEADKIGKVIY